MNNWLYLPGSKIWVNLALLAWVEDATRDQANPYYLLHFSGAEIVRFHSSEDWACLQEQLQSR